MLILGLQQNSFRAATALTWMFLQHTGLGYAKVQVWALEGLPQLEKPQTHIKKLNKLVTKVLIYRLPAVLFLATRGEVPSPSPLLAYTRGDSR